MLNDYFCSDKGCATLFLFFLIYSYHGKILFSAAVMNQECKGSNIFRELVWKEVFFRQRETERVGQTSLSQLSHTSLSAVHYVSL